MAVSGTAAPIALTAREKLKVTGHTGRKKCPATETVISATGLRWTRNLQRLSAIYMAFSHGRNDAQKPMGVLTLALVVYLANHGAMNGGAVAAAYVKIAAAKTALPFWEAFFKGVLCNLLVCLAVWLALAGHSAADKILAIVLPVSAFVAAGFEHSVANMYFLPMGLLIKEDGSDSFWDASGRSADEFGDITLADDADEFTARLVAPDTVAVRVTKSSPIAMVPVTARCVTTRRASLMRPSRPGRPP